MMTTKTCKVQVCVHAATHAHCSFNNYKKEKWQKEGSQVHSLRRSNYLRRVGLHGFLQKVCLNLRSPTSRLQHYHNPIHAFNNCTKFEVDWRGTCHRYSFQFQLFKAAVTLTTNEGHCHLKWFKWIKSSNYCTTMPSVSVLFFFFFL